MEIWLLRTAADYAVSRLSEPSTWAGIAAALAGSMHMQFNSDFTKALIAFGMAGAAMAAIILKEGIKK